MMGVYVEKFQATFYENEDILCIVISFLDFGIYVTCVISKRITKFTYKEKQ